MRSRAVAFVVAVVVPLAALGVVISRSGSPHRPARLPVLAGGGTAAIGAARADTAVYPYGGIVYKAAAGVPELDGHAHAYRISRTDASAARRLADALGFTGIGPDANNTFVKGDEQLSIASSGVWGYVRQSAGGTGVSSSGVVIACAPDEPCASPATTVPEHPADLPSQAQARDDALELLGRAGIDTKNAEVNVDDAFTQWLVRVDPNVDGLPSEGFTTTVTIGELGVVEYANGVLGTPAQADEYPLLGTTAAIDRLNKGEGFVGPRPLAATNGAATAQTAPAPVSGDTLAPTPPPASGDTVPPAPSPQTVTITGAQRVLLFAASYTGDDGWLVPAYRLDTDQGPGPTVLALDDSFLTPPDAVPVPKDTGSTGGGSASPGNPGPPATIEPSSGPAVTIERPGNTG